MKTKRIRRRKLKVKNVLIFLALLVIFIYLITFIYENVINTNIKNIYITGNKYVSDISIIKEAELVDYPKLFEISSHTIKNKLKQNELIKNIKVKKRLIGQLYIEIDEYIPLFYNNQNNNIILNNAKEIQLDNDCNLPILHTENINDINLLKKLIKKYKLIDDNIKKKISEIKYDPNNVDNERFLMTMNDGNYVYVTLIKIEEINYYLKILPTLDDKKGVLNLDYGNNFEIIQ